MTRAQWKAAGYTVTSYGNGWSYEVTEPGGLSAFVQGDDATAWRDGYDRADESETLAAYMADSLEYGGAGD